MSFIRTAAFTDIHWGKSNNSIVHNTDCQNYIEWFINNIKTDGNIDSIIFLGDWFDNRSSVNIKTLDMSYHSAELLNRLDLPIYFIIGNHDLYHRHTREIFSPSHFKSFKNFRLISETTIINDFHKGALIAPYLFHDEYPSLAKHNNLNTWWGHFEFKGFQITGYNMLMPTGPEHTLFDGPKQIFSGHFHKRQRNGNVCYMGNCFPHNFSDAGDFKRGMMIYDHVQDIPNFIDWEECPKYQKITLSDLLADRVVLHKHARVRCMCDVQITYEENLAIKTALTDEFNLRDFSFEETLQTTQALTSTESEVEYDEENETVDETMVKMLNDIDTEHIDSKILIEEYMLLRD